MSKTKDVVVFVVEGSTDKGALKHIFNKLYYRNRNIVFEFTSGDITSKNGITINNIENEIIKCVDRVIKDKKLRKNDIYQVIHILDTDGTYVPNSSIKSGTTNDFCYSLTDISCLDRTKIISRNTQKKSLMDYLSSKNTVGGYQYEAYYLSRNLEHALHNIIDTLSKEEKQKLSDEFYEEYRGKETMFVSFLKDKVANGVPDKYIESWKFIKIGNRSLERHTNLHVYFTNHPLPL